MKFTRVLDSRRSIRAYDEKPVKKEEIKKLIKAALMAPSWKNTESQRYWVVMDDDRLATMKENCISEGNAAKVQNAPVLIVSGYEKGQSGFHEGQAVDDLGDAWGMFDLGLAVENMLLQAASEGLGTLVMGMRNEASIRALLDIPEDIVIGPVIAVGFPAEEAKAPERKKLKEVVVFD